MKRIRISESAPSRSKSRILIKPCYRAPALERGIDILEKLAEAQTPLSQTELAQRLGRTSGEIYRMLTCLEESGYVTRDTASTRFSLTLRLYELGHKHSATALLMNSARLPMRELADRVGQACHLSLPYGPTLIVLVECMPHCRMCLAVGEGTVLPMIKVASGKVMLAHMRHEDAAQLLESDMTYQMMCESARARFWNDLELVRERSIYEGESDLGNGVTDLAIPVGVDGTDAFAVLSMSLLSGTDLSLVRRELKLCVEGIQRSMGVGFHSI